MTAKQVASASSSVCPQACLPCQQTVTRTTLQLAPSVADVVQRQLQKPCTQAFYNNIMVHFSDTMKHAVQIKLTSEFPVYACSVGGGLLVLDSVERHQLQIRANARAAVLCIPRKRHFRVVPELVHPQHSAPRPPESTNCHCAGSISSDDCWRRRRRKGGACAARLSINFPTRLRERKNDSVLLSSCIPGVIASPPLLQRASETVPVVRPWHWPLGEDSASEGRGAVQCSAYDCARLLQCLASGSVMRRGRRHDTFQCMRV